VHGPTPIRAWSGSRLRGRLWVKDEALAGTVYGGNKVRKLAWLLAEAGSRSRRHLITWGGVGSHHVLATALWARTQGMLTHAALFPQPDTPHVRRQAGLIAEHCASVSALADPVRGTAGIAAVVARVTRLTGEPPLRIPVGGSSAVGTLGWVDGGLELARQVAAGELPAPERVYVPVGSGGTAAGLLAGFAMAGFDVEVVGVRVVSRAIANTARVRHLARAALRLRGSDVRPGRLRWMHGYLGAGYGAVTPEAEAAVRTGTAAGLPMETTYSGKALAACLRELRDDAVDAVFLQTASGVELPDPVRSLPPELEALLR
jgi:D-cysteine desulfhydrase